MADTTPTEWFQKALSAYGQNYLDAEKALRAGGETTATALQKIAADAKQTPLARFMAATIANWGANQGANFDAAMNSLDSLAEHAAKTPLGTPPPDTAASEIALFDDISDFVALRTLKETDWPYWKAMTAIIYLGYYATASVLPALEQFCTDLKSGKHTGLGGTSAADNEAIVEQLVEAVQLITIVIKDEKSKPTTPKS